MSDAKGSELKRDIPSRKPLGRLPSWLSYLNKNNAGYNIKNVRSVNRYIAYQERRIMQLQSDKDFQSIVIR